MKKLTLVLPLLLTYWKNPKPLLTVAVDITKGTSMRVRHIKAVNYFKATAVCVLLCNMSLARASDWGLGEPPTGNNKWLNEADGFRKGQELYKFGHRWYRSPAVSNSMNYCGQVNGVDGWWNKAPPTSIVPNGTMCYGEYFVTARRTGKGWDPVITPTIGQGGGFFVFEAGVPISVKARYSAPAHGWGAQMTTSCQTAKAKVSERSSFSTTSALTSGSSTDRGGLSQNQITASVAAKAGFPLGFEVTVTGSYAQTEGVTWNTSRTSSWSDSNQFTHLFESQAEIPPGTLAVPKVQTPMFQIYGVHKLNRLSNATGGPTFPQDGGPGGFRMVNDVNKAFFYDTITVPAKYANGLGGNTNGLPIWYLEQKRMTLEQYKFYCPIDFATNKIAPVMKDEVCAKATIEKNKKARGCK